MDQRLVLKELNWNIKYVLLFDFFHNLVINLFILKIHYEIICISQQNKSHCNSKKYNKNNFLQGSANDSNLNKSETIVTTKSNIVTTATVTTTQQTIKTVDGIVQSMQESITSHNSTTFLSETKTRYYKRSFLYILHVSKKA